MATGRGYQSCLFKLWLPSTTSRHVSSALTLWITTYWPLLHKGNKVHWASVSIRAQCNGVKRCLATLPRQPSTFGYLHMLPGQQQVSPQCSEFRWAVRTVCGPEAGAGEGNGWTKLWWCPVLTTPQLAMRHLWRTFRSTWSYPLFFCSGASVSPNINDRDMQNSHYFWAFFLKTYHTDGILVLSLALLLILRHAYSSMVRSRSPWSTGVPPCYQPLLPRPCKLL